MAQERAGLAHAVGVAEPAVHVFAGELTARVAELARAPVWAMDATETAETVVEMQRALGQLGGGLAVLLAAAGRHEGVSDRLCTEFLT